MKKRATEGYQDVEDVRCPWCGWEQSDMGCGVRCEECGQGPMPSISADREDRYLPRRESLKAAIDLLIEERQIIPPALNAFEEKVVEKLQRRKSITRRPA